MTRNVQTCNHGNISNKKTKNLKHQNTKQEDTSTNTEKILFNHLLMFEFTPQKLKSEPKKRKKKEEKCYTCRLIESTPYKFSKTVILPLFYWFYKTF